MSNPRILLVEDDDFAADFANLVLADDYGLRRAADGNAALEAISAAAPDLVLLDVSLPGIDGYEVCRKLRKNEDYHDLPIIFLSARVNDEERLAGYEAGGDDYLSKPVLPEELRSKIQKALALKAERDDLKASLSSAFSTGDDSHDQRCRSWHRAAIPAHQFHLPQLYNADS